MTRPGVRIASRERLWLALFGVASLAVLLVATRGAPLGVPVSDDYVFLNHRTFGVFDWFDSYGAAWYWRPLSRQAYYSVLGPWLIDAPWVAATVHLILLGITFAGLWAFTRRFLPVRGALVAAAFPLLVEPARVLLGWPSGAQHLLAMAGVSTALGAAAWGRLPLALGGAAIALTSLESAAILLPMLPLAATRDSRRGRARWWLAVAALGAGWLALRAWTASRGVVVPDTFGPGMLANLPLVLYGATIAQLGLEDRSLTMITVAGLAYAAALIGAVWSGRRRADPPLGGDVPGISGVASAVAPVAADACTPGGGDVAGSEAAAASRANAVSASRAEGALLLGGLTWWLAGTFPLAGVPDWNGWRASLAGLGLGVALSVVLSRGGRWPVVLFVGVRAVLLLLAPPATATVRMEAPATVSQMSFVRLARLQRIAIATRATLSEPPGLAGATRVRYWDFPRLSEAAFGHSAALRVWFDDPDLRWQPFGEQVGIQDTGAVVIAYDPASPRLAVRIRPEAQRALCAADAAVRNGRLAEGDRFLAEALVVQREPVIRLRAVVLGNRAMLQLRMGAAGRADSLHRLGEGTVPAPEWQRTEIAVALALTDSARARDGVRRALETTPRDPQLRQVARLLAVR